MDYKNFRLIEVGLLELVSFTNYIYNSIIEKINTSNLFTD